MMDPNIESPNNHIKKNKIKLNNKILEKELYSLN